MTSRGTTIPPWRKKDDPAAPVAGADALEALQARGRLVGTGPELVAIKRMMELHDAQLDRTRITDLDAAVRLVRKKEAILV